MKNCLIVLNYNDYNTTEKFLNNILHTSLLDKIVVVDNCSTDSSYSKLQHFNSDLVHVIKTSRNGGYGYGNNFGFRYLKNLYSEDFNLIISNPDVNFDIYEIIVMCKKLSSNACVISPVIKENSCLNRGWKFPTVWQSILQNIPLLNRIKHANTNYDDSYYTDMLTQVDVVSGCFFAIKSSVFEKIRMFDENVFLYYEENIIASKLKDFGYKCYVDNTVSITHSHSVSINQSSSSYNKLKELKKSQWYYHNHYGDASKFSLFVLKISILFVLTLAKIRSLFSNK